MKTSIFYILVLLNVFAFAQKVVVTSADEKVGQVSKSGFSVLLELDEEFVRRNWQKELKTLGALKTKSGVFVVEQAAMPSISPNPVKVYSTIKEAEKAIKLWYCVELNEMQFDKSNSTIAFLHDFGVAMYIQDINKQIREAENVLLSEVKQQEKSYLNGTKISSNLAKIKTDRIVLLQKLVENDSSFVQVKRDSVQNGLIQKENNEKIEKLKRAVDMIKSKITKVE